MVPLTTGRGLVGDVANDRLSIAVDPFLLVGNHPDAMHREVGRQHKHRRCPKVDGLGGLLPVVLPFFVAGAVVNVGVAVDVLPVVAAGAAAGVAFFLFFFVLAAA